MYYRQTLSMAAIAWFATIGMVPLAAAQTANSPSAANEVQGATTGLGSSHRFKTTADAAAHCDNDTIVWSSGPDLIYHLSNSATYGKGGGFYACKQEADDAGFKPAGN